MDTVLMFLRTRNISARNISESTGRYKLPFILNLACNREKAARKAAWDRGDRLELLMARSFEEATQLEISLRNNKCYIGYVVQGPFVIHGTVDVEILPTASGYRDQTKSAE